MRTALGWLALVVLLVGSAGCRTTQQTYFTALSSEPAPSLGYPAEGARRVRDVAAEVRTQTILWIPTNTRAPTLQDAVDGALARGGGNLLVDVEVEHWWVFVPFFYGQEGWRVRGDVVRSLEPD